MTARSIIQLGTRAETEALFTYPNDGHETQTLEETVKHYIADSVKREGVSPVAIDVQFLNGKYEVHIDCPTQAIANAIGDYYNSFLDLAKLAMSRPNLSKQQVTGIRRGSSSCRLAFLLHSQERSKSWIFLLCP